MKRVLGSVFILSVFATAGLLTSHWILATRTMPGALTPGGEDAGSPSSNPIATVRAGAENGRQSVGLHIERSGVRISFDALELSKNNTIVYYRLLSSRPKMVGHVDEPRLRLADGSLLRVTAGGVPLGIHGEPNAVTFAAIPPESSRFTLEFGPYSTTTDGSRVITLPVPVTSLNALPGTEMPLGQSVLVDETEYRPVLLITSGATFAIRFWEANGAARSALVAGPEGRVTLADDLGTSYAWSGTESGRERPSGDGDLADFQQFSFGGKLNPEASTLRLQVDGTGEILWGPWDFDVRIHR